MAKRFIRTTSENFNNLSDKSEYNNSIVFIEDTKLIWSNGIYYRLEDSYYYTEFVYITDNNVTIEPNKYYYWLNPLNELQIQLSEPLNNNILNIYTIEFTTSESGCTLILPDTIKWVNGIIPTISPSKTYVISIANNLAIIQNFTYAE